MNTTLDCLPCLFRQALDAARRASGDAGLHERFLRETAAWVSGEDLQQPPPVLAQRLHRRLRELTGVADPYAAAKARDNVLALSLLPELRNRVASAPDPLALAVRLAIAGNLIDLGPSQQLSTEEVLASLGAAERAPLAGDVDGLRRAADGAASILYLADNAGEIVVDRLLIERLGPERITGAVRGEACLNDATVEDAEAAGLTGFVRVIGNGSDVPGTVLEMCDEAFREAFASAGLVIAKGQGNFETLTAAPRDICFLFKVKCAVVAARSGLPLGAQAIVWRRA